MFEPTENPDFELGQRSSVDNDDVIAGAASKSGEGTHPQGPPAEAFDQEMSDVSSMTSTSRSTTMTLSDDIIQSPPSTMTPTPASTFDCGTPTPDPTTPLAGPHDGPNTDISMMDISLLKEDTETTGTAGTTEATVPTELSVASPGVPAYTILSRATAQEGEDDKDSERTE